MATRWSTSKLIEWLNEPTNVTFVGPISEELPRLPALFARGVWKLIGMTFIAPFGLVALVLYLAVMLGPAIIFVAALIWAVRYLIGLW